MLWIPLALLAPLLWAASNLIDGSLIRGRLRTPAGLVALTGLFSGAPVFFFILRGGLVWPGWDVMAVGLAVGFLGLLAYYPYFRALETAHPASAILMWNLGPVLVSVLAFILLGERLSVAGYAALTLLVASAIAASLHRERRGSLDRAAAWMALASLLIALEAVMQKWLFARASFSSGMAILSLAGFTGGLAILVFAPAVRHDLREGLMTTNTAKLVVLNEILNVAAVVVAGFAVSRGPVSLVKALGGLQPLFVLLVGYALAARQRHPLTNIPAAPRLPASLVATGLAVLGLALLGWG